MSPDERYSVSVIITSFCSSKFLSDCLQSVIGQSYAALEILLLTAGPGEEARELIERFECANIRLIEVPSYDHGATYRLGFAEAQGDIVCFIDELETLSPHFLKEAVEKFSEDYRIGIVYPHLTYAGISNGRRALPAALTAKDLVSTGRLPGGTCIRRVVGYLTQAFNTERVRSEDVAKRHTWKRILRRGYHAVSQSSECTTQFDQSSGTKHQSDYFTRFSLGSETTAIVIFLSGEKSYWEAQKQFLAQQTWDRKQVELCIVHFGIDMRFHRSLLADLLQSGYQDFSLHHLPRPNRYNSKAMRLHEYRMLMHAVSNVRSDYVLLLNEGIIAPEDVIDSLLRSFCPQTVSATAYYRSPVPEAPVFIAIEQGEMPKFYEDVEVEANAFGCVLIRTKELAEVFSDRSAVVEQAGEHSPERYFYQSVSPLLRRKCSGSVYCSFLDEAAEELRVQCSRKKTSQFDEAFYLAANPDVKQAVRSGHLSSGEDHWERYGREEGRRGHFY